MTILSASPPPSLRTRLLLGLGFVVLALAAYSSAIAGGFIWDDDSYVTTNENLTEEGGLERIWFEPASSPQYYPLVFTTFWLEHRGWGMDATGYHLVNVLIHTLSALLLWRLLARLRVPGALLAGALFLLHPVGVESVAWITERKNVLSLFFMLASATAWFRFRPPGEKAAEGEEEPRGAFGWYVLTLVLFAGALLSKTVTACLPAAILLVQYWKHGRIRGKDILFLLPMMALGGFLGSHTAHLEVTRVGAEGPEWDQSFLERCLIAGRVPWFYLWKLAVPFPLAFFYTRWEIDTGAAWQYTFPIASVLLVVALWVMRKRIGRGPLVAMLYFGGTLLPASGFFPLFPQRFSFVADHFQYHASLGPLVLAAAGGALLFGTPARRRLGLGIAGGVLLLLGTLTWRQGRIYESIETLWEDTVAKTPDSWAALQHLGMVRFEQGRTEEGIALLERAVDLAFDKRNAQMALAQAEAEAGEIDAALTLYRELLATVDPRAVEFPMNVGTRIYQRGRREEGLRLLEGLVDIMPSSSLVQAKLGTLYALEGRIDDAIGKFDIAVGLDPGNAEAQFNLGSLHCKQKNWDAAVRHLQAAARIAPGFPGLQQRLQIAMQKQRAMQEERDGP